MYFENVAHKTNDSLNGRHQHNAYLVLGGRVWSKVNFSIWLIHSSFTIVRQKLELLLYVHFVRDLLSSNCIHSTVKEENIIQIIGECSCITSKAHYIYLFAFEPTKFRRETNEWINHSNQIMENTLEFTEKSIFVFLELKFVRNSLCRPSQCIFSLLCCNKEIQYPFSGLRCPVEIGSRCLYKMTKQRCG